MFRSIYPITHIMICHRCLHRASTLRIRPSTARFLTTTPKSSSPSNPPAATSTSVAQPFSTPLSPAPNAVSLGVHLKPKSKTPLPISSAPAGTLLKGLNFLKGREDPVALHEEEYPEWLWHCLDTRNKGGDEGAENAGDEFSKSKKQRRVAAKRQRKLEARLLASGDTEALAPKVPLQLQTIDLPANEDRSVKGALEAVEKREELTKAMRGERRAKIKERNFLKGMR